jgi:hypothetical protein
MSQNTSREAGQSASRPSIIDLALPTRIRLTYTGRNTIMNAT